MALRDFEDSTGVRWTAWDIPATNPLTQERAGRERRVAQAEGYTPERRSGSDRRHRQLPERLLRGWVCFESSQEKRRLIPPPADWAEVPEEVLERYCREATPQAKLDLRDE